MVEHEYLELGYGETKHKVLALHMPKAMFLDCVDHLLKPGNSEQDMDYSPIADDMRKTAASMDRFPLNEWLSRDRGCGCVVGEYLVARDALKREDVMSRKVSVHAVMERLPNFHELQEFGGEIDSVVREWLKNNGMDEDKMLGLQEPDDERDDRGFLPYYQVVVVFDE